MNSSHNLYIGVCMNPFLLVVTLWYCKALKDIRVRNVLKKGVAHKNSATTNDNVDKMQLLHNSINQS